MTGIFTKRDIAPIMLSILNRPVLSIQFKESLGICFFSRQTCNTISSFYFSLSLLCYRSPYHEDLCNISPIFREPLVHLGTCPNLSHFQPSMSFIRFFMVLPFTLI